MPFDSFNVKERLPARPHSSHHSKGMLSLPGCVGLFTHLWYAKEQRRTPHLFKVVQRGPGILSNQWKFRPRLIIGEHYIR